jgi:hypothetical protein
MNRKISVSLRVGLLSALALSFVQACLAGIRPSFSLDFCSWQATDIVLVEVTPDPGVFRVVEAWKGHLNGGSLIAVPELQPAPGAMDIAAHPEEFAELLRSGLGEQMPTLQAGSQMFLFLKRKSKASRDDWKSADFLGEMKTSAIWIDGGQLYAFQQLVNPGPSVLMPLGMSRNAMTNRVREICRIQLELAKVAAIENGAVRAERLKVYLSSDVPEAKRLALSELGKSGPTALPTIRKLLSEPAFSDEGAELIKVFAEAGGESVGEELEMRLQEQLRFWQATAPTLPVGWWNQDATPHAPLRESYMKTWELVVALEHLHYRPASDTAKQLGDFWRSLPQLNDASGLDQMVKECDKFAAELPPN